MRAVGSILFLCAALVAGCGGGGGSNDSVSGPAGGLTISGQPPTHAQVGQPYSFQPTISPATISPVFSAKNLPAWASISATTGLVAGTPKASDIGTTANIMISATGGGTTATLPAFNLTVDAVAGGSALISWVAPTENVDGSTPVDLSSFRIYYGQAANALNLMAPAGGPNATSYTVSGLSSGTWYFVVKAVGSSGLESDPSNMASKVL